MKKIATIGLIVFIVPLLIGVGSLFMQYPNERSKQIAAQLYDGSSSNESVDRLVKTDEAKKSDAVSVISSSVQFVAVVAITASAYAYVRRRRSVENPEGVIVGTITIVFTLSGIVLGFLHAMFIAVPLPDAVSVIVSLVAGIGLHFLLAFITVLVAKKVYESRNSFEV